MKQIYSDQLVAYLFNEIEPDTKLKLENELTTNLMLRTEYHELKNSLKRLMRCAPLSPKEDSLKRILNESLNDVAILTH